MGKTALAIYGETKPDSGGGKVYQMQEGLAYKSYAEKTLLISSK